MQKELLEIVLFLWPLRVWECVQGDTLHSCCDVHSE
jgi:hypothetical protein